MATPDQSNHSLLTDDDRVEWITYGQREFIGAVVPFCRFFSFFRLVCCVSSEDRGRDQNETRRGVGGGGRVSTPTAPFTFTSGAEARPGRIR